MTAAGSYSGGKSETAFSICRAPTASKTRRFVFLGDDRNVLNQFSSLPDFTSLQIYYSYYKIITASVNGRDGFIWLHFSGLINACDVR